MGLDHRAFLSSVSLAPAATLVTVSALPACQPVEPVPGLSPPIRALREVSLDASIEPALQFTPWRRSS